MAPSPRAWAVVTGGEVGIVRKWVVLYPAERTVGQAPPHGPGPTPERRMKGNTGPLARTVGGNADGRTLD